MREELPPQYDHGATEKKIYELWERSGYFNPDNLPDQGGEPYTIIMPPPNANAPLHVGHALFLTIEDIFIRYQRMRGRRALWLPGFDHAGFETQVVFEKKLDKEGRSRFQMTRDDFYKEVWDFVQENKHISKEGIKRMGSSCDWSREVFTLDPRIVDIVYGTFEQMYKDGLVYRGNRISNWCTKHQTGLADLETKYEEREDPLYYIKYGPITLATVRPETKFGDTGIAVHPDDKRYKKYIGKEIEIETLLGPAKIKVIADTAVDPAFGTGAVKVTPAHDPADFEIWQRHQNEIPGPLEAIDRRGRLTAITGPYAGMKVAEARAKVVEDMQAKGLIEKIDEKYKHNIQLCYKCNTVIEPLIVPQWYVAMTKPLPDGRPSLRDMAIKAIEDKEVEIITERFRKVFMHWMENLKDWPISRQIWWGIPIPAWYCLYCNEPKINAEVRGRWFLVRHGETDANKNGMIYPTEQAEVPLNETGMAQANAAAQALKDKKIDLIISSDYLRAKQTAEAIAKATGAEIIYDNELRERHYGDAAGLSLEETLKKIPDFFDYDGKAGNQESGRELEERIWNAFSKHHDKHKHKNVVVVGHGGAFRLLQRRIRNVNPAEMMTKIGLAPNGQPVDMDILDPCGNCGGHFFEKDPDTFDTWFSSGQWPFATLQATGQATGKKDFENYFPTQMMETGWDILFFWVARMVMLSYYRTGKRPFEKVFLHGLVRDKDRQKMSKSKGNVVDPLGVIDTYGTDALRFALIFSTSAGNDIPLAEEKIKGMKHFANKLWNIARFVLANGGADHAGETAKPEARTGADREILARLEETSKQVTANIEGFDLHEAAQSIYQFAWREFADVYVEASKKQLADEALKENTQKILMHVLSRTLTLLHPFMPFVTEEIYQKVRPGELLMVRDWDS